jgi:hypothetical protein
LISSVISCRTPCIDSGCGFAASARLNSYIARASTIQITSLPQVALSSVIPQGLSPGLTSRAKLPAPRLDALKSFVATLLTRTSPAVAFFLYAKLSCSFWSPRFLQRLEQRNTSPARGKSLAICRVPPHRFDCQRTQSFPGIRSTLAPTRSIDDLSHCGGVMTWRFTFGDAMCNLPPPTPWVIP